MIIYFLGEPTNGLLAFFTKFLPCLQGTMFAVIFWIIKKSKQKRIKSKIRTTSQVYIDTELTESRNLAEPIEAPDEVIETKTAETGTAPTLDSYLNFITK